MGETEKRRGGGGGGRRRTDRHYRQRVVWGWEEKASFQESSWNDEIARVLIAPFNAVQLVAFVNSITVILASESKTRVKESRGGGRWGGGG